MKKTYQVLLFTLLIFLTPMVSFAWNHSIELGYGYSHDPNDIKYNNSGFLLSGDIVPICNNDWSFWSITGSLGRWHTTAPSNQNLTTAALSLALRLYAFDIAKTYPAYFLASFGPAYLSKPKFGVNTQASHATIQSNLGLGAEFNKIDLNLRLVHFSNAHLGTPNQGFNILYLLSIGYLF